MKAILAHHELAGPAHELEALKSARIEDFSTDTLGTLVKALFETYIVVDGTGRPVLDEAELPADTMAFGFRMSMEMSQESVTQTKATLKELVSLRNELIHHLIERFDLWSDEGCIAAAQHLTDSYARIDERFEELRDWAKHLDDGRQMAATLFASDTFQNVLVHGIAPDGTVDWPFSGIVRVLKEAVDSLAVDGWMPLSDAVSWIAERHSEQVPEVYGCRSWPQVLHESKLFRLEYREDAAGDKRAWCSLRAPHQ